MLSKPPISDRRKEFEEWFQKNNTDSCLVRTNKGYINNITRVAWRVWQHLESKYERK